MMSEDHTCRICRGEATASQPLLHPCKCRGSIKYIHQDCLLEWLKHSNKSTEKCDICNTTYRFRIIYDPSMPSRIPLSLVWSKLVQIVSSTSLKTVSIFLYFLCLILQVPLYWKFAGRIYTWAIDGSMPVHNPSFINALLFGEFDIESFISESASQLSPLEVSLLKVRRFFEYTYISGLQYITIAVLVHIALFVEHEWVIRDEGYRKLLLRKIGTEPVANLVDMLQQALNARRDDNEDETTNLQRLETIAAAMRDLQDDNNGAFNNNGNREEFLRRAINAGEVFNDDLNNIGPIAEENELSDGEVADDEERRTVYLHPENRERRVRREEEHNNHTDEEDNEVRETAGGNVFHNGNAHVNLGIHNNVEIENDHVQNHNHNHNHDNDHDHDHNHNNDIHGQHHELGHDHLVNRHHHVNEPNDPPIMDRDRGFDEFFQEDGINEDEIEAEALADAAANANANAGGGFAEFLELFGINLNIKTPIFLMFICDFVISAYLFVIYLIPHMLGNLFFSITGTIVKAIDATVFKRVLAPAFENYGPTKQWNTIRSAIKGVEFVDFALVTAYEYLISPAITTFRNLFIELENSSYSFFERTILLSVGYGIIAYGIYKFMTSLISGKKPVKGTSRKIYKVLFEVSSTTKVFIVFAIEIFFFPVYCGWLLDFCVAPLVLPEFTKRTSSGLSTFVLLTSSYYESSTILFYWSFGTLYMLLFALFVGMVRSSILRPGVLFFIRSPDDPNARLIHDALVKPLMLQLSRIYLSAKVYTGFILVGIGGITWGFRYLLSTTNGTIFLPVQSESIIVDLIIAGVTARIIIQQTWALEYCKLYWTRVFEISCHKLRLSHFILGRPISQERGYVVYRNIFQQIMATAQPDFSNPVSYRQASAIFRENHAVNACFVPNGNYVRAPDNDTISRKFIKKLFVSVTKDDKLLSVVDNNPPRSGYETPTSEEEEELNTDNAYTIVYRPPNFKMRCFGLICMLWVFAVIAISVVTFSSLFIGRIFVQAVSYFDPTFHAIVAKRNYRYDVPEVAIGLGLELALLYQYDKGLHFPFFSNVEIGLGENEVNQNRNQAQEQPAAVPPEVNQQQQQQVNAEEEQRGVLGRFGLRLEHQVRLRREFGFLIPCLSYSLWILWLQGVHLFVVDRPLRFYYNLTELPYLLNRVTIPIHLITSCWTLLPFMSYVFVAAHFLRMDDDATTWSQLLWGYGFYPVLINIGLVGLPVFTYVVYLFATEVPSSDPKYIYAFPVSFVFFVLLKTLYGTYKLYSKINDQVKSEKYVRGRAIENIDLSEDESDN
ncbi:uncharacterized protein RJT20DRAFT_130394 [Scheffersomyces xylosifermentans]|uniref:uncharacterized protein n=1 Tax=Scheffersomyces xylosifermentans TaxID=1304137 RepID=UPI00315CAEA7